MLTDFFSLTPEHVLAAAETVGERTTGLCYPLGSLENRVYEIELDSGERVVAKFYRPGRWGEAALRDEHRLLRALVQLEVPVCAPRPFPSGDTLAQTRAGIWFTVFPRTGGRSPDELTLDEFAQLGRLLGRIHNASAALGLEARPALSPATYGTGCLQTLIGSGLLTPSAQGPITQAVERLVAATTAAFAQSAQLVVHADCHRGNLLRGRDGFFFLDFDDMASGPAVQDLWLLLPARPADCPQELAAMLAGYRQFRAFDGRELRLIEGLRGLRYVRYAAWVASRYDDPAFRRVFTDFGTEVFWQRLQNDLYEQLALLQDLQDGYLGQG